MKKFLLPLLLAAALLAGGCETVPAAPAVRDVPMSNAHDPASLEPYRHAGTATISGQGFLRTRGGEVRTAAGREVALFPATPFFKEAATHMVKGYRPAAYDAVRPQFHALARRQIADAEGRFEFTDLPAGDYMLEVEITWEAAGMYGPVKTGSMVWKFVTAEEGGKHRVMLTL